jgi:hypothetical protein
MDGIGASVCNENSYFRGRCTQCPSALREYATPVLNRNHVLRVQVTRTHAACPISKTQFEGSSRATVPKQVLLHPGECDRTSPAILVSRPAVPASHACQTSSLRESQENVPVGKLSISSFPDSWFLYFAETNNKLGIWCMRKGGSGKVPVFSIEEHGSGCYYCNRGERCPLSGFCPEHAEGERGRWSQDLEGAGKPQRRSTNKLPDHRLEELNFSETGLGSSEIGDVTGR